MLRWKKPEIEDIPEMRSIIGDSGAQGSDSCAANIFLLREKYNIRIAIEGGSLFRMYTGTRLPGRIGMAFPLGGDPGRAFALIAEYTESERTTFPFIYLTGEQKQVVSGFYPGMSFDSYDGNSDYMYRASNLSALEGKDYIKKRNRVNRFCREYPDWEIRFSDDDGSDELWQDMITVEERWFDLLDERVDSVFVERLEITEACRYRRELGLIGAVVYAGGIPVAMSVASLISPGYYDIHFEKCYGSFARAGGFSVINKYFAQHISERFGALWINREEDIGLAGLRRAKMAYHPDRMLEKYHTGTV